MLSIGTGRHPAAVVVAADVTAESFDNAVRMVDDVITRSVAVNLVLDRMRSIAD